MTAAAAEAWGGEPGQVAEQRPSLGWGGAPLSAYSPGWPCWMTGAHPSLRQCQGPWEAPSAVPLGAQANLGQANALRYLLRPGSKAYD